MNLLADSLFVLALLGALFWLCAWLPTWRPFSTRERLLPDPGVQIPAGAITALIPARNEAALIGRTLQALRAQSREISIIVIDDQSDDATASLAAAHGQLRVLQGAAPPPGWMGKLWALEQGTREVTTPWILLLDADVRLAPGLLGALYRKARSDGLALASVLVRLRTDGFWERLLVPAFVYFFQLLFPFALVNDPRRSIAAAAGGCVLLRREALLRSGGFAAMRTAIIDDCTLAGRVKAQGLPIWLGLTHGAESLRGYGLSDFWGMVTRSAYAQLRFSPARLLLCTLGLLALFAGPLWLLLSTRGVPAWVGLAGTTAMLASYVPVLRFYGLHPARAFSLPPVAAAYLLMTWHSALRCWSGTRTVWKQRRYATSGEGS